MSDRQNQTRRQFIKNFGIAAAGFVAASAVPGCSKALQTKSVYKHKQPNIVFIFTDDHAVQSISAYGSRINTTPNLDRIARRGHRPA